VVAENIFYAMRNKLLTVLAFIGTTDCKKTFAAHFPKVFIRDRFEASILQQAIDVQLKTKEFAMHDEAVHEATSGAIPVAHTLPYIGVFVDDCGFDKSALNSEPMKYLHMNGRHDNFFPVTCLQYIMQFPKDIRNNVSVVMAAKIESGSSQIKQYRENMFTCFRTDEELAEAFDKLDDREFLVYDLKAHERGKPYIFYYKAQYPCPEFMVGPPHAWKWHYKHFKRASLREISEEILRPSVAPSPLLAFAGRGGGAAGGAGGGLPVSTAAPGKLVKVGRGARRKGAASTAAIRPLGPPPDVLRTAVHRHPERAVGEGDA